MKEKDQSEPIPYNWSAVSWEELNKHFNFDIAEEMMKAFDRDMEMEHGFKFT